MADLAAFHFHDWLINSGLLPHEPGFFVPVTCLRYFREDDFNVLVISVLRLIVKGLCWRRMSHIFVFRKKVIENGDRNGNSLYIRGPV